MVVHYILSATSVSESKLLASKEFCVAETGKEGALFPASTCTTDT